MGATSSAVAWRFFSTAVIWLIPAALLLPFILLLVALSIAAADGTLLEVASGVRGKVLTALGPLLIGCGIAALVAPAVLGADTQDWITMGAFGGVTIVGGFIASRFAWRKLAREM